MTDSTLEHLGPLAPLAGTWEGTKGDDTAPADDRGVEKNLFREHIRFEPLAPVTNHEQILYGLRYATTAWRLEETSPFHEECGYWMWDGAANQVLRCFTIPRGMAVLAGGTAEPDATSFELFAEVGAPTYGICSNLFLDQEFKTVRFDLQVTVHDRDTWSYEQDTQIQIKGKPDLFHHIDKNTLTRVE